jgi:hypothetical protein
MRFYTTQSALRLVAITLFSIVLASCGQGDGPDKIEDPLFAGGPIVPPVVVVPPSLNLPVKTGFEDAGAVSFGNFGGGTASIIDNPVPTPVAKPNTSAKVGQMIKDGGETFGGSTLTLDEAFDFSESEVLTINVWASRAVPLTFKLEGPSDAEDREVVVTHSGSSTWEELVLDFTGMSPPATTMVTLIFDNGTVGNASGQPAFWTFYFDDIAGGIGSGGGGGELITNGTFESGVTGWVFDPTINSTFEATTDQSTGPGSNSGNLKADGAGSFPTIQQANLAIGTVMPNQSITVSFDLCGAVEGVGGVFFAQLFSNPAIDSELPSELQFVGGGPLFPSDQWQRYSLTTLTGANVDGGVSLLFKTDCGVNADCVVNAYIDNVSLTLDSDPGNVSGAGGACPAAPPPPAESGLPVDFEDAGGPYAFGDFEGGETMVIDNPDMDGNSSARVAQMKKFAGELFGATTLTLDGPIDFTSGSVITMKVWSQRVANVEFKVEGQRQNTTVTVATSGTPGGVWETLTFDFTGLISAPVPAVSIFFDNGIVGDAAGDPDAWTFYVDDIEVVGGGGGGDVVGSEVAINGDFETGDFTGWTRVSAGTSAVPTVIEIDTTNPGTNRDQDSVYTARLQAAGNTGGTQDALLQQVALGAGSVAVGDTINVSFDLYGQPPGPGGVVFVELIYLDSNGEDNGRNFIDTDAPYFPNTTWTRHTGVKPAGLKTDGTTASVDGGVTLQIKASCGAVPECTVDAYVDNVTFEIVSAP